MWYADFQEHSRDHMQIQPFMHTYLHLFVISTNGVQKHAYMHYIYSVMTCTHYKPIHDIQPHAFAEIPTTHANIHINSSNGAVAYIYSCIPALHMPIHTSYIHTHLNTPKTQNYD